MYGRNFDFRASVYNLGKRNLRLPRWVHQKGKVRKRQFYLRETKGRSKSYAFLLAFPEKRKNVQAEQTIAHFKQHSLRFALGLFALNS